MVFFLPAGVVEYLNTEVITSKQKKFSLVTFVDTPGLVDGDMKYPFDVEQAILWLGKSSKSLISAVESQKDLNSVLNTLLALKMIYQGVRAPC